MAEPAPVAFKKKKRNRNLRRKAPTAESVLGGSQDAATTAAADGGGGEEEDVGGVVEPPSSKRRRQMAVTASTADGKDRRSQDLLTSAVHTRHAYAANRSVEEKSRRQKVEAVVELEQERKKESTGPRGHSWVGPMKATTNVRTISRFDYQPDICKDWKETGYCGYGDSCKFLHDRGDYKSGWQLEREWEEEQKRKEQLLLQGLDPDSEAEEDYEVRDEADELPFACAICRRDFLNPVVTKCEHYFCERCALAKYKADKRCATCGEPTLGIFNPARKIIDNLEKLKARRKALESDEGDEDGEEGSEDEDGTIPDLPKEERETTQDWQFL